MSFFSVLLDFSLPPSSFMEIASGALDVRGRRGIRLCGEKGKEEGTEM